jgi:diguanylate cyclase (GGDEF)-like protein
LDGLVVRLLDILRGSELEIMGVAAEVPGDADSRWPDVDFFDDAAEMLLERKPGMVLVANGEAPQIADLCTPDCLVVSLAEAEPMGALLRGLLGSEVSDRDRARRVVKVLPDKHLHERVAEEMRRASRYSVNLSMAIFAIDDLRGYKERNGQTMRDLVLADLADIVSRNVRDVDVMGRVGAERLALVLPETGRFGALKLAERIRLLVQDYPFPALDLQRVEKLTVTVGISSFPALAESTEDLFDQTLEALESGKAEGTNRSKLFERRGNKG